MSKLEQLLQEKCPDGVEYKTLGELCDIRTGKLNANANKPDGLYPFFTCDKKPYRINEYAFDTSAILIAGNCSAHVNSYEGKFNAYQRTYVLDNFRFVEKQFLYFYLLAYLKPYCEENCFKSFISYITLPILKNFKVPIPPIEVQAEIVRILDIYSSAKTELVSKMSDELALRKKQYAYYREKLLTFGDDVEYKAIEEIANYEQPQKYLVKKAKYNDNFDIPVLTAGQTFILGYTNETDGIYPASKSNPVIIFDDFTANFKWVDFPFKAKSSLMKMITTKENVLLRYLYYVMGATKFVHYEHKRLWISEYSKLEVPVPPIEVQTEIVNLLDSYSKAETEIEEKLEADIIATEKQYEYYRDKILTF